jgi:hypothetical protein
VLSFQDLVKACLFLHSRKQIHAIINALIEADPKFDINQKIKPEDYAFLNRDQKEEFKCRTLLQVCCIQGRGDIYRSIKDLLEFPYQQKNITSVNVSLRDEHFRPLTYACFQGNNELTKVLLEYYLKNGLNLFSENLTQEFDRIWQEINYVYDDYHEDEFHRWLPGRALSMLYVCVAQELVESPSVASVELIKQRVQDGIAKAKKPRLGYGLEHIHKAKNNAELIREVFKDFFKIYARNAALLCDLLLVEGGYFKLVKGVAYHPETHQSPLSLEHPLAAPSSSYKALTALTPEQRFIEILLRLSYEMQCKILSADNNVNDFNKGFILAAVVESVFVARLKEVLKYNGVTPLQVTLSSTGTITRDEIKQWVKSSQCDKQDKPLGKRDEEMGAFVPVADGALMQPPRETPQLPKQQSKMTCG